MTSNPMIQPEKRLAAVCGIFCPACTFYIASTEDPERLKALAARWGITPEEMRCYGCRAEKRLPYCANCAFAKCAAEKGIDFCGACDEYPCADLKEFQSARPHRCELWEAQARIQEAGYEQWFAEMSEHYACPSCGTLNSAYDRVCRRCGASPSSAYNERHSAAIEEYLALQRQ
ncbi:MAG: DUF3795 domain-containing protein [Anaerolineae bacterium]|nr:DUF3795 domain-containing protein [Anaerolineae bacterium]